MLSCSKELVQPVITAGGLSTRMGYPKALIDFNGQYLLEQIYQQVKAYFDCAPFIIVNDSKISRHFSYTMYRDIHPQCGPLSGLETALYYSKKTFIYYMACDTPFFYGELVDELIDAYNENLHHLENGLPPQAVFPMNENRFEPLHALYTKDLFPIVSNHIDTEKLAMKHLLDKIPHCFVDARKYEMAFFNINCPDDLLKANELYANYVEDKQ